jgi:hypothetical protein
MAKEDAKQAYALVSLYIALYKTKYGKPPVVNRYREKWAMQDVIDTLDFNRAKEILEYYFKCNKPGHPLNWFLYNFDRLDDNLNKIEEDVKRREKIRKQSKELVERESNEH